MDYEQNECPCAADSHPSAENRHEDRVPNRPERTLQGFHCHQEPKEHVHGA